MRLAQDGVVGNLAPQRQPDVQDIAVKQFRRHQRLDDRLDTGKAWARGFDHLHPFPVHAGIDGNQ